jgi:ribonuclease HI
LLIFTDFTTLKKGAAMSLTPARRRAPTIGLAGARDRHVPADHHKGSYKEFLRRHDVEAQQAALGMQHDREILAAKLLPRASDSRNLMLAIEHCASRGQAAGPNGLRLADLDRQARWGLAQALSPLVVAGEYIPGDVRTVWISKGSGRGDRPIRIQDSQDRVVERAVLQVIRPLVQPRYLDCSYGYRHPGRSRELALAMAEHLACEQDRWLWISQDLRNAFEMVPRSRLMQIVRRMIPADDICAFLERLIQQPQGRGIRQGGCLSPELLNIYLHWLLDRWWAEQFPEVPMLRVADDLLILLREDEVDGAYAQLEQRCRSIGMPLKHPRLSCVRNLASGQYVEWLGYSTRRGAQGVEVNLASKAWDKLEEHLCLAWEDPIPTLSAQESILGWIGQQGATYRRESVQEVYEGIVRCARVQGHDEVPGPEEVMSRWYGAYLRDWVRVRRDVRLQGCRGSAEGYASQHCSFATSTCRRGGERPMDAPPQEEAPARREVYLYCDGSCLEPGGVGGWAYLLVEPETGHRQTDADSHPRTSNNCMELTAVIRGLASLPDNCRVHLVVDSEYVHRGITQWLPGWIANGWRAGGRRLRPLKNERLWRRLVEQLQRHELDSQWVRGHSGHPENELVDRLAREAALRHLQTEVSRR